MQTDFNTHYKNIRLILIWVLALNWLVAAAKIIFGLISKTSSITADGFHSLSDGASNIVCLVGIHFAAQPTDCDHPYGHKKYETFYSLGIALLLLMVAFELMQGAFKRIANPVTPTVNIYSFIVMISTLIINFWVMTYEYKKGKQLKSDLLVSDSMHTKADILVSLSVIAALIMLRLGVKPIIDPIVTIIIALIICYSAYQIIRESSRVLCDTAAIIDIKKIVDVVLSVNGVQTCHKIRTRGRPDDVYIDLHVQVNPSMPIKEAHAISYSIEEALKKEIPEVTDVVVHMEPKEKI
ncbi:MAG: cation diffusion facilitator family transporter [Candidatus Omnitrophica bacterium]|nr:cation diffusion facilitator family transporter [Candidatus Omnitrophota bacterium]